MQKYENKQKGAQDPLTFTNPTVMPHNDTELDEIPKNSREQLSMLKKQRRFKQISEWIPKEHKQLNEEKKSTQDKCWLVFKG